MTREDHISYLETIGCDGWTVTTEAYMSLQFAIEALKQEPCEDAISRQALLEEIENGIKAGNYEEGYEEYPHINDMDDIIECIKYADSIQPKPKTGHWILADEQNKEDVENDNYRFICSECQCSDIHAKGTIVPYCWKCGARMESEV